MWNKSWFDLYNTYRQNLLILASYRVREASMKKLSIIIILSTIGFTPSFGWYPEYTVMASEFVVGKDFLSPVNYNSMTVYALGEGFRDIHRSPLDDIGRNPSAGLGMGKRHFLHLDLGGQTMWDEGTTDINYPYPMYDYGYSSYIPWSSYRESEEQSQYDPLFRLVYLGYPIPALQSTRIGISFDWMYELSEFYQPVYFWGYGARDAMGNDFAETDVDPYDDFQLKQAGDDENANEGYNMSLFLSHSLSSNLDLGVRYTKSSETVDGILSDYDLYDRSEWADEYWSLWDSEKIRTQDLKSNDFMVGVTSKLGEGSELGVSAGFLTADMERVFNETDTSNYYSLQLDPYPQYTLDDSSYYSRTSDLRSMKNWSYSGQTYYGGIQYFTKATPNVDVRFVLYGEQRQADLTESESLYQTYNYESKYYAYWDSTSSRYSSSSLATLSRSGTGEFSQDLYRASLGVEWDVSPSFNFLGGLYVLSRSRSHTATEPFEGVKSTDWERTAGWSPGTESSRQTDKKEFSWERTENEFTVILPVGVEFMFAEYFQFQSGFSKSFSRLETKEQYDVIVETYRRETTTNGVTRVDDALLPYVDGYRFPDQKRFDDGYTFNAGLSFAYSDRFSVGLIFTTAFENDRTMKLGGQLTW